MTSQPLETISEEPTPARVTTDPPKTKPAKNPGRVESGELEGGGRRATDPIWSLKVFKIQKVVTKPETPVVYYLLYGPKQGVCS